MESTEQNNFSLPYEEKIEIDYETLVGGVKVNYYFHCLTQLWLFSHFVTLEHDSDLVILGKILEKSTFRRVRTKNLLIDEKISIDFIKYKDGVVIYDVKKSSKFEKSHYYQVLYYLWYLKNVKGVKKCKGVISYPTEKKRVEILLTPEKESEIKDILDKIYLVTSLPIPPKSVYKKYCRKCAYFEFCWV